MSFSKRHRFRKKHRGPSGKLAGDNEHLDLENAKSESAYFKSLIDSRAKVTVVLKGGERLQGRIRYYDRHCFSVGLSSQKRKIFLRKESVSYIAED